MRLARTLISMLSAASLMTAISTAADAQCPLPYQITNGQTADASQVMGDLNALATCVGNVSPGGSANALQYNSGSGSFGGIGPLTNGQLAIGSTGNTPQAGTLTPGSGISITNGPGSITISATAAGTISPFYDPSSIAITRPVSSAFTVNNSTGNTGALSNMASRGVVLTVPSGASFITAMEQNVPSSSAFTVTAFVYPVSYLTGNWFWGLAVKDTSGKYVGLGFRNLTPTAYFTFSNINTVNTFSTGTGIVNAQNPVWVRLQLTGGNFIFSFSFDGENFVPGWTVSSTAYLSSSLATVGIITDNNSSGQNLILDVFSWTSTSP